MVRVLAIFVMCLLVGPTQAQTNNYKWVPVDESSMVPGFVWSKSGYFEPVELSKSKNQAEIRIYSGFPQYDNILIFSYNKEGYQANYYSRVIEVIGMRKTAEMTTAKQLSVLKKKPFKQFKIVGQQLDSIFLELIADNVFSLPTQDSIKKTAAMQFYTVQYKLNKHLGTYSFSYPDFLIKQFPDIKEFQQYRAILSIYDNLASKFYPQRKE